MKELRFLNKYFFKYRGRLLAGLIITVIATVFRIVVPAQVGNSMDAVKKYFEGSLNWDALQSELLQSILIIVGAALLSGFFTFLMRQTIIVVLI